MINGFCIWTPIYRGFESLPVHLIFPLLWRRDWPCGRTTSHSAWKSSLRLQQPDFVFVQLLHRIEFGVARFAPEATEQLAHHGWILGGFKCEMHDHTR